MKNQFCIFATILFTVQISLIFLEQGVPKIASKVIWTAISFILYFIVIILFLKSEMINFIRKKMALSTILLLSLSLYSCLKLTRINQKCIVHHPMYEEVVFPIKSNGDLEFMINNAGGRYHAIEKFGRDQIIQAILKSHVHELSITIWCFFLSFQFSFLPIFVLLGVLFFDKKSIFRNNEFLDSNLRKEIIDIKNKIAQSNTKEAFSKIDKLLRKNELNDLQNELIIVKAKFNRFSKYNRLVLRKDEVTLNQINYSLLQIIEKLNERLT